MEKRREGRVERGEDLHTQQPTNDTSKTRLASPLSLPSLFFFPLINIIQLCLAGASPPIPSPAYTCVVG